MRGLKDLGEMLLGVAALLTVAAWLAWLAVLPSIGLLWLVGGLP